MRETLEAKLRRDSEEELRRIRTGSKLAGMPSPCRRCQELRTELGKLRLELEEAQGEVAYQKGQAAYWKAMAEKRGPHHLQGIGGWRKANPVKPIDG